MTVEQAAEVLRSSGYLIMHQSVVEKRRERNRKSRLRVARGIAKGWAKVKAARLRHEDRIARHFADPFSLRCFRRMTGSELLRRASNWDGRSGTQSIGFWLRDDRIRQLAPDMKFAQWGKRAGLALDYDCALTALLLALYEKWHRTAGAT